MRRDEHQRVSTSFKSLPTSPSDCCIPFAGIDRSRPVVHVSVLRSDIRSTSSAGFDERTSDGSFHFDVGNPRLLEDVARRFVPEGAIESFDGGLGVENES